MPLLEEARVEALEYRVDNFIVLELRGRVDEFNTSVLRDEIHTIINTGRFRIAVDLSKTEFLSAHCLSAVWSCQRRARRIGGDLVLVGPKNGVEETIDFVKIRSVVSVYPTLEQAQSHFSHMQDIVPVAHGGLAGILRRFFQYLVLLVLSASVSEFSLAQAPGEAVGAHLDLSAVKSRSSVLAQPYSWKAKVTYTLDQLLEIARKKSGQARLSELQRQSALQDVEVVRSQNFPKLLLTSGYLYQSNPNLLNQLANRELNQLRQSGSETDVSNLKTKSNISIEKDVLVVSAGLMQAVYTGGLYEAQLDLAEARSDEQQASAEVSMMEVDEIVKKLYWGIVLAEQRARIIEMQLEAVQGWADALRKAEAQKIIGVRSVAEAELEVLQAERDRLSTLQELTALREYLNRLLGFSLEERIQLHVQEMSEMKSLKDSLAYLQVAELRSPSIRLASARVQTALAYERAAQSSAVRSPKAFLLGSVDHTRGVDPNSKLVNWTLGFAVTVPLLDGGKSSAELEKSRLLIDQARVAFDDARRKLYLDIREAVSRLNEARLAIDIAERTLRIARAQKESVREAVARQQIPLYQLQEAGIGELKARVSRLLAEADYMSWKSRLQTLVGEESL